MSAADGNPGPRCPALWLTDDASFDVVDALPDSARPSMLRRGAFPAWAFYDQDGIYWPLETVRAARAPDLLDVLLPRAVPATFVFGEPRPVPVARIAALVAEGLGDAPAAARLRAARTPAELIEAARATLAR